MINAPGIYDIPSEEYHRDPVETPSLSASVAWTMLDKSPAHGFISHPRLNPDFEEEQKAIFDLGSAAHNMILRQDYWREQITIVEAPDWRTKAAREARDEARAAGRYPVLRDQYEALQKIVVAIEHHPHASRAFTDGKPEQTIVWRDEETGSWCRIKPDWMSNSRKSYPDLKTTQSAKPEIWDRRFIMDHGGLLRSAFYDEGIRQITGEKNIMLYYVVVEINPPYPVIVRCVDQHSNLMAIGRRKVRQAMRLWAECLEKDEWPAYDFLGSLAVPEYLEKKLDSETPE